jgi:hypothetical protein
VASKTTHYEVKSSNDFFFVKFELKVLYYYHHRPESSLCPKTIVSNSCVLELISDNKWAPCHEGLACSQDVYDGDVLHMLKISATALYKQLQTVEIGCFAGEIFLVFLWQRHIYRIFAYAIYIYIGQ